MNASRIFPPSRIGTVLTAVNHDTGDRRARVFSGARGGQPTIAAGGRGQDPGRPGTSGDVEANGNAIEQRLESVLELAGQRLLGHRRAGLLGALGAGALAVERSQLAKVLGFG
jgi:hypothetical protein